jgi:hypothetical protein
MARCGFVVPLILLLMSAASAQTPPLSDPEPVGASQSFCDSTGAMHALKGEAQ